MKTRWKLRRSLVAARRREPYGPKGEGQGYEGQEEEMFVKAGGGAGQVLGKELSPVLKLYLISFFLSG